jgi:hypothetical protein
MANPLRRASLVKPGDEADKAWPAIAIGFFVAFGGVLFGYVRESTTDIASNTSDCSQLRYRNHQWHPRHGTSLSGLP